VSDVGALDQAGVLPVGLGVVDAPAPGLDVGLRPAAVADVDAAPRPPAPGVDDGVSSSPEQADKAPTASTSVGASARTLRHDQFRDRWGDLNRDTTASDLVPGPSNDGPEATRVRRDRGARARNVLILAATA